MPRREVLYQDEIRPASRKIRHIPSDLMGGQIYSIAFACFEFYPEGYTIGNNVNVWYPSAMFVLNSCCEPLLRYVLTDRIPKVRLWSLAHLGSHPCNLPQSEMLAGIVFAAQQAVR